MTPQHEHDSATSETVQRAERLERAALEELHDAADSRLINRLGLERYEDDGVLVSLARHEPHILLNRVLGLGTSVPGDPQHSYHNLLKAGFREAYARENLAPASD